MTLGAWFENIQKTFPIIFFMAIPRIFPLHRSLRLCRGILAILYTNTSCTVGNQLDSGIMVRLALGGLGFKLSVTNL